MPRNPLNDGNPPFEPIKGEKIVNDISRRVIRLIDQHGNVREFVLKERISKPDAEGIYSDTEIEDMPFDHAGNPLPQDPRCTWLSHTDLFVDEKNKAVCTHWLHSEERKIIYINQDGRLTPNGAICSRCESMLRTLYAVLAVLIIAALIGIYRGVGYF